jgi:hypothetical protein
VLRFRVLWRSRFPDSREGDATHDKQGSNTKKADSSLWYSGKRILEPQRGSRMCGLLVLVVRKGSNFEPILCGLSPLFLGGGPLACIYTF